MRSCKLVPLSWLLLGLLRIIPSIFSLGYLKTPRSRNLVAFEDTVWWPRTESDPEPETTPQGADRGGTLAQCGIVETLRNYDLPQNVLGDLMPINVQAIYEQEQEINIRVSLISSNGGHFVFSLCPIEWGEIPTQECFDAHPLEFVKDNYYDATEDPNYPERIYIPDGDVVGRVDDLSGFPGNKQEFSYQMNLPCGLTGDLVLLQWYFVTAQDCYHEGYPEYDFPASWGDVFEEKIEKCPSPLPPDGNGLPLQYWNCAEVQVLNTGPTDRCAPTLPPSLSPTVKVTQRPTKEPTKKPTARPVLITDEPTVQPSDEPTSSPIEIQPLGTCDDLCLIPITSSECLGVSPGNSIESLSLLKQCLSSNGKTVEVGAVCEGSGECDTTDDLENCAEFDVYRRAPSCARDDRAETPEDTPITIPVLDNDVDALDGGLTIVEVSEPQFGVIEVVDNEILYTPDENYNGPDTFTYEIIDSNGFISQADVFVDVSPVNDPPLAIDDTATTPFNEQVIIPVLENDVDADGDILSIESVSQPSNGVAGIRPDGDVIYKPNPNFAGQDEFTYRVCDSNGDCDEATVSVEVLAPPNEPPVAEPDFVTLSEGLNAYPFIPVLANDRDPESEPLVVVEVTEPKNGSVEVSADQQGIRYTPDNGFSGEDTFLYTTCDPAGLCDSASVLVTIDPASTDPFVFDDRESTKEGEIAVVDVTANDLPPNLVIVEVTQPNNGGTCAITDDNQIMFVPDENFFGQIDCTYKACVPGTTQCDDGTLIMDVIESPDIPPIAVDDPATTLEDVPVTLVPLENDVEGSAPMQLVDVTDGRNGTCTIGEKQTVTYTPATGFYGIDICLYTVCDQNDLCDQAGIVISVTNVNEPPTAEDDVVSTPHDSPATVPVLQNDLDPDEDALTITDVTDGLHGMCSIEGDTIIYQPNQGYAGPDICPYVICDTSNECATANVFIDVEPPAPDAIDDQTVTEMNKPKTYDVLDNDISDEELQIVGIITTAENGDCRINKDNDQVVYTPNEGFTGRDSCSYSACISTYPLLCDEAELTVNVEAVNAQNDLVEVPQDSPQVVDVLSNDQSSGVLTVTDVTVPSNGECLITEDNQIQYIPSPGFVGRDTCTYTACTDSLTCDEANLLVEVLPKPDAEDDSAVTPMNESVLVDVIANDKSKNGPISISDVGQPSNGRCVVIAGELLYSPDKDFVGDDSCIYEICTGDGVCDGATVMIKVLTEAPTKRPSPNPTATPLVVAANDDKETTIINTDVTSNVLENDAASPEGKGLEVSGITSQPSNGSCSSMAPNSVAYSPRDGFIGTDRCTYQACITGTDVCDTAELVVDVVEVKIAQDDRDETPQGESVLVDVLANDIPPTPDTPVIIDNVGQANNGQCQVVDGQVLYSPDASFTGVDRCSYKVCAENTQVCDSGELTINVIPKPDAEDDFAETLVNEPILVDVLANDDSDEPITVSDVDRPSNGRCEIVGGQVLYVPDEDHVGSDSCLYEICTADGLCDEGTLTVSIVSQVPTRRPSSSPVAVDLTVEAKDDKATALVNTDVNVDVLENDTVNPSSSSPPLEVTGVDQADNGSCTLLQDGTITYSPNVNFLGTDSCVYKTCVKGDEDSTCDTALLIVDVVEVKIAEDDRSETPQEMPVLVDVLSNDTPPSRGDYLVVVDVDQANNGECEVFNNSILYTPRNSFAGRDSCTYTVCVDSTSTCDEGEVFIDVFPKPEANPDEAETPVNESITVDVTSNDDPNGSSITITEVGDASHGSCEAQNGVVVYLPIKDYVGSDKCQYTICSEEELCDTGMLTINVIPKAPTRQPSGRPTSLPTRQPSDGPTATPTTKPTMGQRPYAVDDFTSTAPSTPISVEVLFNDFEITCLCPDSLTVISTGIPSNGSVKINSDSTVTYTPDLNFAGDDSFTYTISDPAGNVASAIVIVSVLEKAQSIPVVGYRPTSRPTRQPSMRPTMPVTLRPTVPLTRRPTVRPSKRPSPDDVATPGLCAELCFDPVEPDRCPLCDPLTLPSCSDPSLQLGDVCESDGDCGLNDQLNNCEGTFDVYRRVACVDRPSECIPREGEVIVIHAHGDTSVTSDQPESVLGGLDFFAVDESPKTDGLVQFKLSDSVCECVTIKRATLKLYVINQSRSGGFVHVMNPYWKESETSWSNAPDASGPPLVQIGYALENQWIDVDVTELVNNSDEYVAMRIEACVKNRVEYASKEYLKGQYAPKLVLELGPPPMGAQYLAHSDIISRSDYGRQRELGRSSRSSSRKTKITAHTSGSRDTQDDDFAEDILPLPQTPICPAPISKESIVGFSSVDDATIVYSEQDRSFGSDALLEVSPRQCGEMHAMIRFDVSGFVNRRLIQYAGILVHAVDGSHLNGATFLHTPVGDWDENDVTWKNSPEYDKVLGSLSTIEGGIWYELDVTRAVRELDGNYLSIRVVAASVKGEPCNEMRLVFSSRELGEFGPRLIIAADDDDGPPIESSMKADPVSTPSVLFVETQSRCGPGVSPPEENLVLTPTDDAYLSARRKRMKHGSRTELRVDGQGNTAVLKFELSCLESKDITSAILKLYVLEGSSSGGVFHVLTDEQDTKWVESEVNWNKANISPADFPQYRLQRVRNNTFVEIDITDAVASRASDFVTVMIKSTKKNGVVYSSKEGQHPPELILSHRDTQPPIDHLFDQKITCSRPALTLLDTFEADDACVIKEREAETNFEVESRSRLIVKDGFGSRVDALVMFKLDCLFSKDIISQATLRLFVVAGSPKGGRVVFMSSDWNKSQVTWRNAPTGTSIVLDYIIGRAIKGRWIEVDVTEALTSTSEYYVSFRIEGVHRNPAIYSSGEENAPQLIVAYK